MSPDEPNQERPSSEDTLVPGKESEGKQPGKEEPGFRNQTRPIPVDPEADKVKPFHTPTFDAPAPPRKEIPVCCWVAVVSSLTSVVLAAMLWARTPSAPAPAPQVAPAPAAKAAPPPLGSPEAFQAALKPYLDAAQAGDTNAMRMLGTMYYHGLDLPRNREEGLKWYRKAAASGSKVAAQELKQLE